MSGLVAIRESPAALAKESFMHTIKRIYNKLLDPDYIAYTIRKAARGKRKRDEVRVVLEHIDEYTSETLDMITTGRFELKPVSHKTIFERGKTRELTLSPFFPNRILDYLMVETLKPYIRKSMYEYCVGNVDKRGIDYGERVIERNYKRYKYYLKLDIRKFYPSVTSENLYAFLERKIADKRFLRLCKAVVMQVPDLPIGSYYSQWFSNWYLQDLDHYIKEELRVPLYVRYVDDMVLMGNNKRKLLNAMYCINRKLGEKGLELKEFGQVKRWDVAPLDFLGFRFGNEVRARSAIFHRITKLLCRIHARRHITVSQARSLLSYIGWVKYFTHGYAFYNKRIKSLAPKGRLRRIISEYDRRTSICQQ